MGRNKVYNRFVQTIFLEEGKSGKSHQNGTKTFEELTYSEQASSINAQLMDIEASIKANIKRAVDEKRESPKEKRIKNLEDLIERLKLL
jgi:hypothetical protein